MKKTATADESRTAASRPAGRASVWIAVTLFMAVFMFVVGVMVGRGHSPVTFNIHALENELKVRKAEAVQAEIKHYKLDPASAGQEAELGFFDDLKKPAPTPIVHRAAPAKTGRPSVPPKAAVPATTKPAHDRATTSTPAPLAMANAKDTAAPLNGHLTVQVASVKDAQVADGMVSDLIKKGYPAYRVTAEVAGKGTWYRVRVGKYGTRAAAAETLARLQKDGKTPFLVLID